VWSGGCESRLPLGARRPWARPAKHRCDLACGRSGDGLCSRGGPCRPGTSPRRSGTPSRCPRLWHLRWWRRSRSKCRSIDAMPGSRVAGRCLCSQACGNASTVALPTLGSASAPGPARASRARMPLTAAWARLPTALAASGCVSIPRYGPLGWPWRSGRKSGRCWPIRSGWPRHSGAGDSRRRGPNARPWPRGQRRAASSGTASPG
jgi:hypothetical protein